MKFGSIFISAVVAMRLSSNLKSGIRDDVLVKRMEGSTFSQQDAIKEIESWYINNDSPPGKQVTEKWKGTGLKNISKRLINQKKLAGKFVPKEEHTEEQKKAFKQIEEYVKEDPTKLRKYPKELYEKWIKMGLKPKQIWNYRYEAFQKIKNGKVNAIPRKEYTEEQKEAFKQIEEYVEKNPTSLYPKELFEKWVNMGLKPQQIWNYRYKARKRLNLKKPTQSEDKEIQDKKRKKVKQDKKEKVNAISSNKKLNKKKVKQDEKEKVNAMTSNEILKKDEPTQSEDKEIQDDKEKFNAVTSNEILNGILNLIKDGPGV